MATTTIGVKRTITAILTTPALSRRQSLIVNYYLRRYPMKDFPRPMRGARVVLKAGYR